MARHWFPALVALLVAGALALGITRAQPPCPTLPDAGCGATSYPWDVAARVPLDTARGLLPLRVP